MAQFKLLTKILAIAAILGLGTWGIIYVSAPAYNGTVGITYGSAYAPVRDKSVDFHVWYPATPGGRDVTVGGNGVFHGTRAGRDAPSAEGRYPVILVSHGAGGNATQFGWIASKLAKAGYVVVLPNHPGTTSRNASAEAAVRVWERPADISAVIAEMVEHPQAYPFIDTDRIATLGFSAGGYTAMALAGARVDPDALQNFCDNGDQGMSDCAFLKRGGIDLHAMDLSPAGQDLRDPHIRAAVIIDPGIVSTLTKQSLSTIDIPMLVINLGEETHVPAGVYARPAAEMIPSARYEIVPDASHFSFLAQCTAKGAEILAREGEPDPLCDDAGGRARQAIHDDLSARILGFLETFEWQVKTDRTALLDTTALQ